MCLDLYSVGLAVIGVAGLVTMSYVTIKPARIRQKGKVLENSKRIREQVRKEYLEEFKQEYEKDVARWKEENPGKSIEDERAIKKFPTLEFFIDRPDGMLTQKISELSRDGKLKEPPNTVSDRALIAVGFVLSAVALVFPLLVPSC